MAKTSFKGNAVSTVGELPQVGAVAKFSGLVKANLSEVSSKDYAGKNKVISIFPSIDTPVCANSVRKFNQEAAALKNTVVLNVSADLPFAQARFCGAEGITNCETLSTFRSHFGKEWGVQLADSALHGLMARAVIVLSPDDQVLHAELVPDIAQEPNYEAALKAVR
jgi:thiol peroxidase